MGLIDQAVDLVEMKVNDVQENVKDILDQADYELSGAVYDSILTTKVGKVIGWAQKNALWPATFGLACCAIEMMAMARQNGSSTTISICNQRALNKASTATANRPPNTPSQVFLGLILGASLTLPKCLPVK